MNAIEAKINAKAYPSISVAKAVVKRAQLGTRMTNRLLMLIDKKYIDPSVVQPPKKATNGSGLEPTATFAGSKESELDNELMRLALKALSLAVKHKLSREEIFDKIRNRLYAGID